MRKLAVLALYTGLAFHANTGWADADTLSALRTGDMAKLTVHSTPIDVSVEAFMTDEGPRTLADYRGKVVLVNFWATWCAPCRKEMPSLAALQDQFGGDDFEVLTIAVGRNPRPAMERFMTEIGVTTLPFYTDERQALARSMGVLGLPVTILIDRKSVEIARLQGDADWASDSAQAIIAAILAEPAQ